MTVGEAIEILSKENSEKQLRILFEKNEYRDDTETITEVDSIYCDDEVNGEPTVTIICGDEIIY